MAIVVSAISLNYFDSSSELLKIFYADLVGSIIVFIACLYFNNISLYDPYWTLQASCISLYYFINWSRDLYTRSFESHDLRYILVFILVNIWSIRLTSNLFINSVNDIEHEDWRYADFRIKFPSKFAFTFVSIVIIIYRKTSLWCPGQTL